MEARWILALIGGRAPSLVLRASFFAFRVKVCRGSVQMVVADMSKTYLLSRTLLLLFLL
jgi:hypothetical protein